MRVQSKSFTDHNRPLVIAAFCVLLLSAELLAVGVASAQNYVLTVPVLINSQNSAGYNTNPQSPGEFQRFAQRYLEHLQIPYELIDVSTQAPPDLSQRQLIISGHSGLGLSAAWQTAIMNAVSNGVGFVNLDSSSTVGQQLHIENIFATTGSSLGTPGTAVTVPAAVLSDGASPHYIAALQQRFAGYPPGDIVYAFHADSNGVVQTVTSTVLTGAAGTVIARIGTDPLIVATSFGAGRAVHFGTLTYLRADRFGFMMGTDDLFWRSLVWAARKPFVVRGYPRFWAVEMDDTLAGWPARVRDMYNTAFTGTTGTDGTGGPWRVTGYAFIDNLAPGSTDRAMAIADVVAGSLQLSPHAHGISNDYGTLYWDDPSGNPLTATTWGLTIQDIQNWIRGNGGSDTIPSISRSMVPHFWNLSTLTGADMWNTIGFRYVTEIQVPGIDFYSKTATVGRPMVRPFRLYELPPMSQPNEDYPIYQADDYVVNGQTFFNFTTQVINLNRYDRTDVGWPNTTRTVQQSIDQFEYYTWRLWSGLAPTQIYTHDGASNYVLSTPQQRQQVIQTVASWLNVRGARHVFMQDLGDYMYARTKSTLTSAQTSGGNLTLTFTGNSATANGVPIATQFLLFLGDDEGTFNSVAGFVGGSTTNVTFSNPVPAITGLAPTSALAGGAPFTLTVNGTGFVSGSVVNWNGASRTTTYVSATQLQAAIPASDIATAGTAQVTVFTPAPGGGTSNSQPFNVTSGNFPVPTITQVAPTSVVAGGPGFTVTVNGTNFVAGSVVQWNGANRTTSVLSSTQLTASIPASDIATTGNAQVTVFNPGPGGGTSAPVTFTTTGSPVPTTTSLSPSSAATGGPAFTLTVNGTGFVSSSIVQWNGANRTTTFVSATQLTAAILASDIAAAGTVSVTVFTPAPGGGTSNAQSFTIATGSPVPTTTSLSPSSAASGGPAFTLTVNGTGFVSSSVVQWNGASRTTTFVSATQLTAAILASDIAAAGTVSVTVFTAAPGGGTSNAQSFTISGSASGSFVDNFARPDSATIGNGWIQKSAAFAISSGRVTKVAAGPGYLDNLVYRPATENMLHGEASVEVRFNSLPPGYAQVFVRGQTSSIASPGTFNGYLLYTDNDAGRARLDRINGSAVTSLAVLPLSPALNTTDTYRLRLRAIGTNPVVLSGYVERLTTSGWTVIGQAVVNDSAAAAFTTAGSVGFSGDVETGVYSYGNFTRTSFDGQVAIDSIIPTSVIAGSAGFMLTINGRNFPSDSVVQWNGANRTTTVVSGNQLTAVIAATDIATQGIAQVTVFSASAGNATSNAQPFGIIATGSSFVDTFNRPNGSDPGNNWTEKYPPAFSIQNNTVVENNTGTTLDYHDTIVYRPSTEDQRDVEVGIQFQIMPGQSFPQVHARTQRNTIALADTLEGYIFFVDGFQPAPGRAIIARQQAVAGQFECYLMAIPFTSALQQGIWYRLRFQVTGANPVTLTGIVEQQVGSTWQLFASGTTTHDNNTQNPGIYCDPGFMPPPITTAGSMGFAKWTTNNEFYGTFSWVSLAQTGSNPAPTTTSLSPSSATAGGAAFTLTVNGTNFVNGSVVQWNGANRTTTFVSATQLTAAIQQSDIASAGTASVTVVNPAPGGGTSNAQTFTISASNPVPTTTSLSPTSATAGGAAFTLTVNGTNFINGSVVQWNGANRTTTFVSATQVTAAIPATDIAAAGTASVTVVNPAPGGGTSNPQTFTISAATTTVTFDNPVPSGSSGSLLNGLFQGINFGTGQWRWEGPFGPDTTNNIYFASSTGTSRTFTFSPGPRTLVSIRVFTAGAAGTLSLSDNLGQTRTQTITTGSMQLVTTGWTQASTTVTVTFPGGWNLGVDDIVYR